MASDLRIPYIEWGLRDPSVFIHRVEKHVNVTVRMIGRLASTLLPEDVDRLAAAALRDGVVTANGEWPGPVLGWMMQAGASSAGSPHLPTYWRWGYGHAFGGGYSDGPEAGGDHSE